MLLALEGGAQADTPLAAGGQALLRVTWSPADNARVKEAAGLLADYLNRMTGASFAPAPGTNDKALIVCLRTPGALSAEDDARLAALGPEAHMIRAGGGRVLLAGNSEKAVLNACYDLLERLGCRWLIPSARWTVVPRRSAPSVPDMAVFSEPHFAFRSIWYAYGMGADASRDVLARDYNLWADANRLGGVAKYKCGHTYPSTVAKHEKEFQTHPEYFAMTEKGERLPFKTHQSLCYSNPRVAEVFIEDKLAELRADKAENPYAYTVSMDPNDGSDICHCGPCKALGNGSDQCLHLANQVARALRKEFPDAVVTFYVYASHRLPPEKVQAEPNINVQVAMGFNNTQYTLEELVRLWREKVSAIGIRDYLGVMAWDWGLPGRGKGSSFKYVTESLPKYKAWGATSYNAEINANWGTFGPAVYVAARLLRDTQADADAVRDDFFRHAYGAAAEDMKGLHTLWADSRDLTRQNLHLWFRRLEQAFASARNESPEVKARLLDMASYLHYVRLYADWESAVQSRNRERCYEALQPLLEFTWRTRERGMVHAYALQRRLVNSGHPQLKPLEPNWRFNDPKAVWKHPEPMTDAALAALFQADLAATPPDTRQRAFSKRLLPLPKTDPAPDIGGSLRRDSTWYVLADKAEHLHFSLPMKGVRFAYDLRICDSSGDVVWETAQTVESGARYEQKDFSMEVRLPRLGLYRFDFNAGEDYSPLFPAGMKAVLEISEPNHPMLRFFGGAFYVPENTDRILLKTDGRFTIAAPGWKSRKEYTAADEDRAMGCIVIPVGNGAGKMWTVDKNSSGRTYFLNIPPYLAQGPERALVPAECLEKASK